MDKLYILLLLCFIVFVTLTVLLYYYFLKHSENFTDGKYNIIETEEERSYLIKTLKDLTIYSSNKNRRHRRVWSEEVKIRGPVVAYLNVLSSKYNKPYVVLAHDADIIGYIPDKIPQYSLYFVASRVKSSNLYTYALPQNDDSFELKTIKDNIPFENKRDEIMWRGSMNGSTRYNLLKSMNSELCVKNNIQFITNDNKISKEDQMIYKYLLCIDGHGWPGSINWSLETNCCVFIRSDNHVWYYDLLIPWVDCIFVENYDDLKEKLYKVHSNQNLAKSIGINGSNKIRKIYSLQKYYLELIFSKNYSHNELMKILKEKL